MKDKIFGVTEHTDNFNKISKTESILVLGSSECIQNPYITIAIPTYNRIDTLKEAIDSALNQKNIEFDYEIIIVDNQPDSNINNKTEKLIKTYADPRILYYRNKDNLGMFGNWNRCIELSRGKWVSFLHDDDLLKTDYLSKVYRFLAKKKNVGAIVSNYGYFGKKSHLIINNKNSFNYIVKNYIRGLIKNKYIRIRPIDIIITNGNPYGAPTCGALFNKEFVIKEGGFNEELFPSGDWFFLIQFNKNYRIYKPIDLFGYYRIEINEYLNPNTLRESVKDASILRELNRGNSFLGKLIYYLFNYEDHARRVDGAIKSDKSMTIKPEEFNGLCEYKIRPFAQILYKVVYKIFWRVKQINACLFS